MNPYQPPVSVVEDAPNETPSRRPETVFWGQFLIWVAWGAGLVQALFVIPMLGPNSGNVWLGALLWFAMTAFWNWLIYRRKNWARWIFIILTALSTPFSLLFVYGSLSLGSATGLFQLALYGAYAAAACLLCTREARRWYQSAQPIPTSAPGAKASEAHHNLSR